MADNSVGNIYDDKTTMILWRESLLKVLDWNMSDLNQVILYSINNSDNQQWNFLYDSTDDTYQIMCGPLTIDGRIRVAYLAASKTDSTLATNNPEAEKWRISKVGTYDNHDVITITNVKTGKVLTGIPNGNGQANGLVLEGYKENSTYQQFIIGDNG